jgi:hypothetical protein
MYKGLHIPGIVALSIYITGILKYSEGGAASWPGIREINISISAL